MEKIKQLQQRAVALWGSVRERATPRVAQGVALAVLVTLFVGVVAFNAGSQSRAGDLAEAHAATEESEGRVAARDRRIDRLEIERDDAEAKLTTARDEHREEIEQIRIDSEQREAAVAAREQAVTEVEQAAARREFSGGTIIVGDQVESGLYRTAEIGDFCYYAWMTDTTSGADIVDNNIVESGTATATLSDGDVFESSGCGTWSKIN